MPIGDHTVNLTNWILGVIGALMVSGGSLWLTTVQGSLNSIRNEVVGARERLSTAEGQLQAERDSIHRIDARLERMEGKLDAALGNPKEKP